MTAQPRTARIARTLAALLACATIAWTALPARADVGVTLDNGLRSSGAAPAGADVRIRFRLAKGAHPRLTLHLTGSRLAPVSFTGGPGGDPAIELHTPDDEGNVSYEESDRLLSDALDLPPQRLRRGRSTFTMRGFNTDVFPDGAPRHGFYELVLRTNAFVQTQASGRFTSRRVLRQRFQGDADNADVNVNVILGDEVRFAVRRVDGDLPHLVGLTFPNGVDADRAPTQILNRRGARTKFPFRVSSSFGQGVLSYHVGYQDGGAVGAFKGVARIKPGRLTGTVPMIARNPPGVPLSVREFDGARAKLEFSDLDSDIGIAYDDRYLIATGERTIAAGDRVLIARRFTVPDLKPPGLLGPDSTNETLTPFVVATQADFPQGEVISGHRLVASAGDIYAAVGVESGNYIRIFRFRFFENVVARTVVLNVLASAEVVPNAGYGEVGKDFFLTVEEPGVLAIGLPTNDPTRSHRVRRFQMENFNSAGPVLEIGRSADALGHVSPVAVQQRTLVGVGQSPYFELWGGDRQALDISADLHRQQYAIDWSAGGPDKPYIFDYDEDGEPDQEIELAPTGLSIDQQPLPGVIVSGASIVHYVVPDLQRADGTGTIHRRVFRDDGTEVIGSNQKITGAGLSLPMSRIINVTANQSFVFVAFKSDTGPEVRRYALTR